MDGLTPKQNDIADKIKDIIRDILPDETLDNMDLDKPIRDQVELDSMDFLDIVMELRKSYGIEVPEADYPQLRTLRSSAVYLEPKMKL